MSATPQNAGAGWGGQPLEVSPTRPTRAPEHANPEAAPCPDDSLQDSGRNALQALLAFACIHEQAAKRRATKDSATAIEISPTSAEDEFALDEVLQLVAARAISITGADGVAVALADKDAIVCRASAGSIAPDPGVKLDPNSGFSGACLRSGSTVRCDDSDTDSRVNAEACRALGTRSMIAVPLMARRRVVGLIEAFSAETFGFNDSDVRSLNLLGELILAAIRPEEEDRLVELAKTVVISEPVPEPAPEVASDVASALAPEVASEVASEVAPELAHAPTPEAEGHNPEAPPPHAPARLIIDEKFAPRSAAKEAPLGVEIPLLPELQLNPKPAPIEAPGSLPKEPRSVSSILVTAALILIVIGLGWAVFWKGKHIEQTISASTRPVPSVGVTRPDTGAPRALDQSAPGAALKPGATPEVTGIRHWSSQDSSTVVVDLQDQVQYEPHSLDNPSRIYFDLHNTKMASGLLNQSIDVNDTFLKRIRMAQPVDGVTRVVLETKNDAEFSVSLDPNPYRLTIQVHKPAASIGVMASPATLSKPSPVVTVAPKKPSETKSALNPTSFQIVLDAGHGGWDLGTVGRKGLLEKDLVLDIVQRLGKLIETRLGTQVIYTRQGDSYLPLEKRAEIANIAKADLFLSVHANYSDLATARGVETYYTTTYSSIKARTDDDSAALKNVNWTGVDIREKVMDSHRLAADVQQSLYSGLAARNPDIRNRGVKEAQYVVLTGTQMPAVLAEVSFVSSPYDEDKLQSSEYRQQIAEALYRGVAKYRDESRTKLQAHKN